MDNWRINQLRDLLRKDRTDEFVIYALGQEYLKIGEHDKSIEFFEQLRLLNPEYVGLYYHLAAAYIETEQNTKAQNIFTQGIEIATKVGDHHALAELRNAKTNFELNL